jgi:hypothetical protein
MVFAQEAFEVSELLLRLLPACSRGKVRDMASRRSSIVAPTFPRLRRGLARGRVGGLPGGLVCLLGGTGSIGFACLSFSFPSLGLKGASLPFAGFFGGGRCFFPGLRFALCGGVAGGEGERLDGFAMEACLVVVRHSVRSATGTHPSRAPTVGEAARPLVALATGSFWVGVLPFLS